MNRIPQQTVDQIYAAADVVEVVGDFIQLKKRGANYWALSPFTNEKTPSFAVSPAKNIWKDFSTGKGGNSVGYLMEAEGMTYPEALKYLAEKYSITIEYEGEQVEAKPDHSAALKALSDKSVGLFTSQLNAISPAMQYLIDRGITQESIATFQIGYAPNEWEWLAPRLQSQGFSKEAIKLSGLCFENDTTAQLTDRFRNRVMFPISNHFGQVVAFGGRIFGDGKGAKYINSPESDIYHKSRILYGLNLAAKSIREKDFSILTEGYLDVIMLHQSGIRMTIASCGTALTKEQCQLIRRYTLNVLIVRDSDKAGLAAMVKDVRMLLSQGLYPSVLPLPKGDDPDSFCRRVGGDGFEAHRLRHTRNFVDFLVKMGKASHDDQTPQGRAAIINEVVEVFKAIQDPVLLHTSQQRLSALMQVPMDLVGGGTSVPRSNGKPLVVNDHPSALVSMHPHEQSALRLIVNHGEDLVDGVSVSTTLVDMLQNIPAESFTKTFGAAFEAITMLQNRSLESMLSNESLSKVAGEALQISDAPQSQDHAGQINAIVRDFNRHHLSRLVTECKERMATATEQDEKDLYFHRLSQLATMLRKI